MGQPRTVGDGRDDEDEESEHNEPKRGWKHSRDGPKIYNNNGNNSISRSKSNERLVPLFPGYGFSRNHDGLGVVQPEEPEQPQPHPHVIQHAAEGDHNNSGYYHCSEKKGNDEKNNKKINERLSDSSTRKRQL